MKMLRNLFVLLAVVVAFSSAGVSAQSGGSSELERQVQKKILRMVDYGVFDHIDFRVDNGTVTLEGKVANARNKRDAEAYVEDVPGVTRVVNNIEILPPSSFDADIRRALYTRISNFGGLSRYLWTVNPSVRLIVDRGHVTLEGYVANKGDYNSMFVVANGVSGVFSVTNNLVIDNGKAN